ncbi:MAG: TraB/GumN family protein [Coraliomargarita sp.]
MKAVLGLFCWLSIASSALCAQSSVWKISKADQSVYLGGTCHILRKSDYPLPAEFDQAYAAADTLVFEVDPTALDDPAFASQLMRAAAYTDGRSLQTVLNEEAYKALAEHGAKANLPIGVLNGMKPGMALMMLTLQELTQQGVHQEGVDIHYSKRAAADGKGIQALETAEFQIEILATMGEGYESEFVLYGLKDLDQIGTYFDILIAAWREGDLGTLNKLFIEDMMEYPQLYQDLLVLRNLRWLPQIETMLKTPETELVLVGVGHAVGQDGLIKLLEAKGYSVEQVLAKD